MKALAALMMVIPVIAGCSAPAPEPAAPGCALACPVDPVDWPDWNLPDGAEVVLAFDEGHGEVQALARSGTTWLWIVERPDGLHFETWNDGALVSHPLGRSASMRQGTLVADERGAWFIDHGDAATLVHWRASDRTLNRTVLPDVDGNAWVRGVGRDAMVIAAQVEGLSSPFGTWDGAWHDIGTDVLDADILGNTVLFTQRTANGSAVRATDAVTGTDFTVEVVGADVSAVSADGGLAFVVDTSDGPVVWGIDEQWRTTELGPGDRPAFIPAGRVYVDQDPGDPPHVRFHSDVTNSSGAAFYLRPRTVWTVTEQGVAWVEPPSADPRFVESPNPTPFEGALFTRS